MVLRGKATNLEAMKALLLVSCLILLFGFTRCTRGPSDSHNSWLGHYELKGYDDSGNLVFTGTISLLSIEQNHLKGQCRVTRANHAPDGLFDQQGNCESLLDGKKVDLDLAPYLDDAGLLLQGELNNGQLTGVWRLDGFVTSDALGRFEAVKKKGRWERKEVAVHSGYSVCGRFASGNFIKPGKEALCHSS